MEIIQEQQEQVVILKLVGRLDVLTIGALQDAFQQLEQHAQNDLILDFSELSFISSSGLRVLLVKAKMMNRTKGRLVLCTLQPKVKRIFDLAGFSILFTISSNLDMALQSTFGINR